MKDREPAEEDLLRMVDYVDGKLDSREACAFEVRLADDPELAAAMQLLLKMGDLRRRAEAAASPAVKPTDSGIDAASKAREPAKEPVKKKNKKQRRELLHEG